METIRILFGDRIYDFLESSPIRIQEKAKRPPMLQTTECVRTGLPQQDFQDGIIRLDIGSASEFARILFPETSHIAICRGEPVDSCIEGPTENLEMSEQHHGTSTVEDHGYFTLKGASVSAIGLVFNQGVCDAIESSELRAWERAHLLLETTDCITMNLHRRDPNHGTVRLRIGFLSGIHMAHNLYRDNSYEVAL